jgi:hypothetical protein
VELKGEGKVVLKFGRGGEPHERLIKITGDLKYLMWDSGWFCKKLGKTCYSKFWGSTDGRACSDSGLTACIVSLS